MLKLKNVYPYPEQRCSFNRSLLATSANRVQGISQSPALPPVPFFACFDRVRGSGTRSNDETMRALQRRWSWPSDAGQIHKFIAPLFRPWHDL